MTRELAGLVWCDVLGDAHDPRDTDPESYGPLDDKWMSEQERGELQDDPIWTYEDRDDTYGSIWHYDCPGPHYDLWKGAQL